MPLPHLALSWVLCKVENPANSSLQDEATDCCFLCVTWRQAQLVSLSVALLAKLVYISSPTENKISFPKNNYLSSSDISADGSFLSSVGFSVTVF